MAFLDIKDTINGKEGSIFFTINGEVAEQTGIQKISTKKTIKDRKFNTIGTLREQAKITGTTNTGTMTVNYYMISTFSKMLEEFEETGVMPSFDIMVTNQDPGTTVGKRTVKYFNCVLNGDIEMSKLDGTSDESVETDINFSYEYDKVMNDYNKPKTIRE